MYQTLRLQHMSRFVRTSCPSNGSFLCHSFTLNLSGAHSPLGCIVKHSHIHWVQPYHRIVNKSGTEISMRNKKSERKCNSTSTVLRSAVELHVHVAYSYILCQSIVVVSSKYLCTIDYSLILPQVCLLIPTHLDQCTECKY